MKIYMKLLSDTIFGNGASVPGAEDISVLRDAQGFPYYKGGSFKGIFRESLELYLRWMKMDDGEIQEKLEELLGSEYDKTDYEKKIVFSDFTIPKAVKKRVLDETGYDPEAVTDAFTNMRVFTAMDENGSGTVKNGSLRMARCVNKNIVFTSEINCSPENEELIKDVLSMIKWIGTLRNRGFGKIRLSAE